MRSSRPVRFFTFASLSFLPMPLSLAIAARVPASLAISGEAFAPPPWPSLRLARNTSMSTVSA